MGNYDIIFYRINILRMEVVMKVLIRKIRHSDYLGIIDLYNNVFNKNIMYHDVNSDDDKIIVVAEADNVIVAFLEINVLNNEIENKRFALINNICVKDKFKNSKIEVLLIQACEKLSKDNNCVSIHIMKNSNLNLDFYKKLGFDNDTNLLGKEII